MSSGRDLSSDIPDIPTGLPTKAFRHGLLDTNEFREKMPSQSMLRPGFGKDGKAVPININSHEVAPFSGKNVYQYNIEIGSNAEKRGLIKAVWESNAVKEVIGDGFIFDGHKTGW